MAKIIIDNWTAGLAPKNWINPTTFGNRFGKPGQILSGDVNPFYQPGYLVGGNTTFTAITNEASLANSRSERWINVDDNVIDTSSGVSIYGVQANKVHAINPTTSTLVITGSWPHTVDATGGAHDAHTTFALDDIVEYQLNGVRKVFYSYRDNTDGDISTWDGTTFIATEDVFSTATGGAVLTKTHPISMVTSQNGFMYVLQGSFVYKFDGTTAGGAGGTVSTVLTLPNSRLFVDAVDHQGKLWLLTQPKHTKAPSSTAEKFDGFPSRSISVIAWNRDSTVISTENTIKIDGCEEAFYITVIAGVVHVFARGTSAFSSRGTVKIFAYNGNKFVLVKEVGDSLTGTPACRGAFIPFEGGVLWQDINGLLFWYGNILAEGDSVQGSLFTVGRSGADAGTGGAIIDKSGAAIYVQRLVSGAIKMGSIAFGSSANAGSTANLYLAPVELPKLSTINGITVVFYAESNASTSTLGFSILNKNNGTAITKNIDLDVDIPRGYVYFPLAMEKSNMVGLYIASQSGLTLATMPKIARIEIDYTPIGRLL
jgi:hypothetical protein